MAPSAQGQILKQLPTLMIHSSKQEFVGLKPVGSHVSFAALDCVLVLYILVLIVSGWVWYKELVVARTVVVHIPGRTFPRLTWKVQVKVGTSPAGAWRTHDNRRSGAHRFWIAIQVRKLR